MNGGAHCASLALRLLRADLVPSGVKLSLRYQKHQPMGSPQSRAFSSSACLKSVSCLVPSCGGSNRASRADRAFQKHLCCAWGSLRITVQLHYRGEKVISGSWGTDSLGCFSVLHWPSEKFVTRVQNTYGGANADINNSWCLAIPVSKPFWQL